MTDPLMTTIGLASAFMLGVIITREILARSYQRKIAIIRAANEAIPKLRRRLDEDEPTDDEDDEPEDDEEEDEPPPKTESICMEWSFTPKNFSLVHWAAVELDCPVSGVFDKGLALVLWATETIRDHPGSRLVVLSESGEEVGEAIVLPVEEEVES